MFKKILLSLSFLALPLGCVDQGGSLPDDAGEVSASVRPLSLPLYGVWADSSAEAADQRALRGDPPDIVFFPGDHVTGSDAIATCMSRFGGSCSVRIVVDRGFGVQH